VCGDVERVTAGKGRKREKGGRGEKKRGGKRRGKKKESATRTRRGEEKKERLEVRMDFHENYQGAVIQDRGPAGSGHGVWKKNGGRRAEERKSVTKAGQRRDETGALR